jgi:trans-aconitate 2-methyltransferase
VNAGSAVPWDPVEYRASLGRRRRPIRDLAAQVPLAAPDRITDLGCGPGNSMEVLAERWPDARIEGVDSSPEMLAAARQAHPHRPLHLADIASWAPPAAQDLLFSCSALHWLPDHETLLPRLLTGLRPGGVLAVQLSGNARSPAHTLVREVAGEQPWRKILNPRAPAPRLEPPDYRRILAPGARSVDVWETTYLQEMDGLAEIVASLRPTVLRSLARRLDRPLFTLFLAQYQQRLAELYPAQPDGKVIFPFRRIFMVAVRKPGR